MAYVLVRLSIKYLLFIFLFAATKLHAQEVAFTLPEADLIPEGIGWSARQQTFYISSIYRGKIVAYDPSTGKSWDFIREHQDGYDGGLGIMVDDKRNSLWSLGGMRKGDAFFRGIFCWNLSTGELINSYSLLDTTPQLFNDIALDKKGNAFITDTYGSRIYYFNAEMKEPTVFLPDISYPNGIASHRNNLYIASHNRGIVKVDIRSKEITYLEKDSTAQQLCTPVKTWRTSMGIDGLKYYKRSLIGVQNGFMSPQNHKVTRYYLERKKECFRDIKIMDEHNPHFMIPTTGVVANGKYYLIANSNLANLEQSNNTIPDRSKLTAPAILKYEL